MGEKVSYISIAENDYQYLKRDVKEGRVANIIAYNAQNICERYLKGIIEILNLEEKCLNKEMSTHSIRKLCRFLQSNAKELNANYPKIMQADGFYFNTRYPGDDYFEVSAEDIKECWAAVEEARNLALTLQKENKEPNLETALNYLKDVMQNSNEPDVDR